MNLNGDNNTDVLVLEYHYKSGSVLSYHAYHGNNLTLIGEGVSPEYFKSFLFLDVYDDDGDGLEELFVVSDTRERLIKMDSDLTWTGQDLSSSSSGVRGYAVIETLSYSYIGVVRADNRIDIHNAHELQLEAYLDPFLPGYSSIDYVSISSFYNSTMGRDVFIAGFNYLKQHPEGAFRSAVERWYGRVEPLFFEASSDTLAGTEKYLATLPSGPHANSAAQLRDAFRAALRISSGERIAEQGAAFEKRLAAAAKTRDDVLVAYTPALRANISTASLHSSRSIVWTKVKRSPPAWQP